MASATLLGRPIWYELMTTDTAAAERFYRTVVGWTAAPMDAVPCLTPRPARCSG